MSQMLLSYIFDFSHLFQTQHQLNNVWEQLEQRQIKYKRPLFHCIEPEKGQRYAWYSVSADHNCCEWIPVTTVDLFVPRRNADCSFSTEDKSKMERFKYRTIVSTTGHSRDSGCKSVEKLSVVFSCCVEEYFVASRIRSSEKLFWKLSLCA